MPRKTILLLLGLTAAVYLWSCAGTSGTQNANRGTGVTNASAAPDIRVYAQPNKAAGVNSVAFDSDGKRALSGSDDGIVRLWDLAKGQQIRTFRGHADAVTSVCFSPDGTQFLSGSNDKTVRLWDIEKPEAIKTFNGHTDKVTSVSFSPIRTQVLSGSMDWTIRLWNTETGREIRRYQGHRGGVRSVAFHSERQRFVSGAEDGTVRLWDVLNPEAIKTFPGHGDKVTSVSFSSDEEQILSGSDDMTVRLWDIASDSEIKKCIWPYYSVPVTSVSFGPDGTILSGSDYGPARLWEIASETSVKTFPASGSTSVAFSPSGKRVLTGSRDGSIELFDINGSKIAGFTGFRDGEWVVITPNGDYNASANGEQYIIARTGGRNYGIDQYRTGLNSPNIIVNRLVLPPDPLPERSDQGWVKINLPAERPDLWVLSIGVSKYGKAARIDDLSNTAQDAKEIVDFFRTQEDTILYRKVDTRLIADIAGADAEPTSININNALRTYFDRAKESDVMLLFMIGHGQNDNGNDFYFLPSDAERNVNGSIIPGSAISHRDINGVLEKRAKTKLIFIDACYSEGIMGTMSAGGKIYSPMEHYVRSLPKGNYSLIFVSSERKQTSEIAQANSSKNIPQSGGAFTIALLEGLKGGLNGETSNSQGIVSTNNLAAYIKDRVLKITDGRQDPQTYSRDGRIEDVHLTVIPDRK